MKIQEHVQSFTSFRKEKLINENGDLNEWLNESKNYTETHDKHPSILKSFANLVFDYLKSKNIEWTLENSTTLHGDTIRTPTHRSNIKVEGLPITVHLTSHPSWKKYDGPINRIYIYLESVEFSSNLNVDRSFEIFKASIDKYLNGNDSKFNIIKFLEGFRIKKYKINDDLSVDILEPVEIGMSKVGIDLSNKNLIEIPVKFNSVIGDFRCSNNNLKNLKNCPNEIISGYLIADNNNLDTLEGATEIFSKLKSEVYSIKTYGIYARNNNLKDLSKWNLKNSNSTIKIDASGNKITKIPDNFNFESVYGFILDDNEIKDISNIPGRILENSSFQNNKIENLPVYSSFKSKYFKGNPIKTVQIMSTYANSLDFSNMGLSKIENLPRKILGSLDVSGNNLTSLEGFPTIIEGNFDCSNNHLTSLKGCPTVIESSFLCSHNKLSNLIGAPKKINGIFDCSNNNITSLKDGPEIVREYYNCSHNQLVSLEGLAYILNGKYFSQGIGTEIILVINDNKVKFRKKDVIEYFENLAPDSIKYNTYVEDSLIKYLRLRVERE